jgi:hypothetical protein
MPRQSPTRRELAAFETPQQVTQILKEAPRVKADGRPEVVGAWRARLTRATRAAQRRALRGA